MSTPRPSWALTRRGLALDRVSVVSFAVHDRIMRYFFHLAAPTAPPGFVSPGIAGVIRADKEPWLHVARECRAGCKADARGNLPVEVATQSLHTSALVTFHLMPLQLAVVERPVGPTRRPLLRLVGTGSASGRKLLTARKLRTHRPRPRGVAREAARPRPRRRTRPTRTCPVGFVSSRLRTGRACASATPST